MQLTNRHKFIIGLALVTVVILSLRSAKQIFSRTLNAARVVASGDGPSTINSIPTIFPSTTIVPAASDEYLYWYRYRPTPTPIPDDPSLYWYRRLRRPPPPLNDGTDPYWYRSLPRPTALPSPADDLFWYRSDPTPIPNLIDEASARWYRYRPTPTPIPDDPSLYWYRYPAPSPAYCPAGCPFSGCRHNGQPVSAALKCTWR